MARSQAEDPRRSLDRDALQVPETFAPFSYVLTQQMIDEFREGVMDPEAGRGISDA